MSRSSAPSVELLRDSEEALRLVLRCLEDLGLEAGGDRRDQTLQMHLSLGLLDVHYRMDALEDDFPGRG